MFQSYKCIKDKRFQFSFAIKLGLDKTLQSINQSCLEMLIHGINKICCLVDFVVIFVLPSAPV